ncbi:MAG: helix-turn-helix domain-containing protein, partial [Thermomicrobiales bacterium]|nr:helix-turn-helix domain-containing protein [Thermomicrobiales bacterium]
MPDPAPDSAQRARAAFWIDDAVIDTYAPLLRRARGGPAALAVYTALARRAGPDGGCWPSLRTLAAQTAASERTVQRALQALEQLGLVAVTTCYEAGSRR